MDILCDIQDNLGLLTLNRVAKHNAFNHHLLLELHQQLDYLIADPKVRVIVLKANGKHFSAGADLEWMRSMVDASEEENISDALILANLMSALNQSQKPTLAMIQGSAFGGGAGLAAACDIAIAANSARFCFSEVKLGLIPAVISPYVIKSIGERTAQMLFMSAAIFDATQALSYNLVQHCVSEEKLFDFTLNYAQKIAMNAPKAVQLAKKLVKTIAHKPIDQELVQYTASLIAKQRISAEGQQGIHAFLNKETPHWT